MFTGTVKNYIQLEEWEYKVQLPNTVFVGSK